jgi:nucleotide-binding universal stress UspA family protein
MSTHVGAIVVGIDDSLGSDAAIRWAIEEARARKLPVHLVYGHATQFSMVPWAASAGIPEEFWEGMDQVAQGILDAGLTLARALGEDLEVTGEIIREHPVVAVPRAAHDAALIVVGSRQLGTPGSFFLGSVSGSIAAHATCPVVVARGIDVRTQEHRPVVLGVAPSPVDDAVVDFAFHEASLREAPLHAVMFWHQRTGSSEWLLEAELHEGQSAARRWLSEALAGWREKYPDVELIPFTDEDHAASGLVRHAADAQLIVVGQHGLGAHRATLLGSVSQAVLHHATCPVAVVPAKK